MTSKQPVALITNANSYVGPALARELVASNHALVLHAPEQHLVDELQADGARVITVAEADLTTAAGNQTVIDTALEHFGRLDAACFVTGDIVIGSFLKATSEQWEHVKAVNLDMVFHALQAALPPMVEAGRGQIVVFTSAAGARPEPRVSLYGATRAGANALVRAVGKEYGPKGVCVNAIGTNFMDFPGFVKANRADDPERREKLLAQVPMRRLGTMEELAAFTSVLLDGRSRFQTGQFFSYSGGWSD